MFLCHGLVPQLLFSFPPMDFNVIPFHLDIEADVFSFSLIYLLYFGCLQFHQILIQLST